MYEFNCRYCFSSLLKEKYDFFINNNINVKYNKNLHWYIRDNFFYYKLGLEGYDLTKYYNDNMELLLVPILLKQKGSENKWM